MEIEEEKQAVGAVRFDVAQNLGDFHDGLRWLVNRLKSLQSFGHGPAKSFDLHAARDLPNQLDDFRFLARLNGHQRGARANDRFEIVNVALRSRTEQSPELWRPDIHWR
jgi:hypothetical protein